MRNAPGVDTAPPHVPLADLLSGAAKTNADYCAVPTRQLVRMEQAVQAVQRLVDELPGPDELTRAQAVEAFRAIATAVTL